MRQWAFLFFGIVYAALSFGQTGEGGSDRLNLLYTDHAVINSVTSLTVYYGGVFEHKGNTLASDSSYTYENEAKNQFFEAFGNVVITQPSGTVIYADKLHYDALVQLATLTGNVRMVDANSVLTTNYLTYNMRSKTGRYRSGGRIVSRGDTITSKNAYYFENSADAYFRHDVVVRTPNVKVFTDSMRYNSVTKETYFFGPTNIQGNQGENLYTERGTYNTGTGIARFNLNNLYTEGTKFLKGDSLYYNRDLGIGEAYRNVLFVDTLDKFYASGDKGLYRQVDESIMMTEQPLITIVVKNDSTGNDAVADSTAAVTNRTPMEEINSTGGTEGLLVETDDATHPSLAEISSRSPRDSISNSANVDSVYMTADTIFSKMILLKEYNALDLNLSRDGGQLLVDEDQDYGDDFDDSGDGIGLVVEGADPTQVEDPVERIDESKLIEESTLKLDVQADSVVKDTLKPPLKDTKKAPNVPTNNVPQTIDQTLKADSVLRQQSTMPTGNEADEKIAEALLVAQSSDTTEIADDVVTDSTKTRIVRAYYNVRLFKSDLQAVADSVYYGMADSMFRFMGRPMVWAEDSQISADTIFMQIINQQIDNALLKDNAFLVNATLDTLKFNQLKGRKITAFFANNNIDRLFVDGNAENIAFSVNEKTNTITEMFHDRGSRIKVRLEDREIVDYITIQSVDQKIYPFNMITQENEILPGFIWRPQDRPRSKEDLLSRKRDLDRDDAISTTGVTDGNTSDPAGQPATKLTNDDEGSSEDTTGSATKLETTEVILEEENTEEEL